MPLSNSRQSTFNLEIKTILQALQTKKKHSKIIANVNPFSQTTIPRETFHLIYRKTLTLFRSSMMLDQKFWFLFLTTKFSLHEKQQFMNYWNGWHLRKITYWKCIRKMWINQSHDYLWFSKVSRCFNFHRWRVVHSGLWREKKSSFKVTHKDSRKLRFRNFQNLPSNPSRYKLQSRFLPRLCLSSSERYIFTRQRRNFLKTTCWIQCWEKILLFHL